MPHSLVNHNGPGSAASSIAETIVKPDSGTKSACIQCGDYECCCLPIPCSIM